MKMPGLKRTLVIGDLGKSVELINPWGILTELMIASILQAMKKILKNACRNYGI